MWAIALLCAILIALIYFGIRIALLCAILIALIYFGIRSRQKYWERRGVPFMKPWFLLGNFASFAFRRISLADAVNYIYYAMPNKRYFGLYLFLEPTLIIRDPELIKQITVKDFDAFSEHKPIVPEGMDSLWDKNLFAIKDIEKWRSMRSTLSPSFTSSKMRMMFPLIYSCAKQFSSYFIEQQGMSTVEVKDTLQRFANDVISTTAFGIICDSMRDRDNQMYRTGKDIFNFSGIKTFLFSLYDISPSLVKFMNLKILNQKNATFFRNIIKETIAVREKKGIIRPDMIHLLMEAQKGKLKDDEILETDSSFAAVQEITSEKAQKYEITEEDIVAQAIIFYGAGFDSVSTAMAFACYELAINPDIQNRLVSEIKACNGQLTYEYLIQMKYLDMVISESLRKWPPTEIVERLCTREFKIEPKLPDENVLTVDPNIDVWIPIYGIHRDPEYYENPEKFDPERFSPENRNKIQPFTYMPFGIGPRGCIGSRFALLEIKLILFEMLDKFEIVPVEKTQIPLELSKGDFGLLTKNGIWLGFKPRQ